MAATAGIHCSYFVARKRRYCKLSPAIGKIYCGEHAHLDKDAQAESNRKRIQCPLDPKHSIYEDQLKHHLTKCNSREKDKPIYYEKNLNSGSEDYDFDLKVTLSSMSNSELKSIMARIKTIYNDNTPHIIDCISYHPIMQSELDNPANGMKALKHLKQTSSLLNTMKDLHLLQSQTNYVEFGAGKGQLSHWIKTTLNDSTDNLFLLVDRGTNRYKFDSKSSEDGTHFERLRIDIEHLDLDKVPSLKDNRRSIVAVSKHLCGAATDLSLRCLMKIVTSNTSTEKQEVRTTPYVNSHEINLSPKNESAPAEIQELPTDVFTGKKLSHTNLPTGNQGYNDRTSKVSSDNKDVCASMSHEYHDIQTSASMEPINNEILNTEGNPSRLNGIVIALCCHHKCLWRNYVGKDFFKCQGLTAKDFNVISLLTSWATCAIKKQQLNSVEDPVLHSNSSDSKVLDTSQAENVPEDNPHVTQSKCERCKSTNLSTRSCERNSEDVTGTSQNAFDKDKEGEYWEIDEREQIGKMCKRLIDIGRIKYLQSHGFNVQLGHYVTPGVSLENVVLMASPK